MEKPLLIVVASSYAAYRSYIFRTVSSRYRLWLLNPAPPTWELPYIEGCTVVNCLDQDALTEAAAAVAREHKVAGFYCYDEVYIETAAWAGAALGLQTLDPAAVARCRDKTATRQALEKAGIPQPASRPVATLDEAREFAERTGYPVILKPRNLGGSLGLRKVERPEDLAAAFEVTKGAVVPGIQRFEDQVIIEEFLDGPEVSIDSVVFEGECTPMIVGRKVLGESESMAFEEIGHDVDGNDPLLDDPGAVDLVRRTHEALGFDNGFTHAEYKVTPKGLYAIEVNARLGGGMIPYLGMLTSGTDAALAAADVAAGRRPTVAFPDPRRAASVRFAYPAYDMQVETARAREELLVPPIHEMGMSAVPGMTVKLPPHGLARSGYVIAIGATLEESRAAVADPARFFEITGKPLS
ncbi:ATP-grasp domain-containing protein [Actinomadura rupiterrae]|uniref:ATP-grasp domain-containing protein n=1 Tax=Actinomadura rupiterrae TaxID=559627 RepID=UPI0020A4D7FB|nr:ATP-grasp domain-containing protein [Actinomadura rupiterrae]MCP2335919.1 biotin carboxylase [Actinomadura rupiterrae]